MTDDLIARLRSVDVSWSETGEWCAEAADLIETQAREIERLRKLLLNAADWLKDAPIESGICCCGDPIEGHSYYSGHSPVDAVQYSAMQLREKIRAALEGTSHE